MATLQKLWNQNNNRLYWEKREQKQRELYMLEEAEQEKELERIYRDMYQWAETEINRFYGKYADAEGIDITEAKKRVSQADIEEYERLAQKYVKDKDFSDRANQEMRLYNATMKINRLEMLKARIGLHLVDGINDIDKYYEKVITDRTRQEIERQAGILGETVSVADTTKRAKDIVNASFFNATYSERIWSHQDRLRSMISVELQKGLIAGIGSRQMASNIRKEYDVSFRDAHRLMVTELRRVQTDVAMDSYKASGVKRYVYMAVNPNACPICREIDGKDFPVDEAQPAVNAPPMHPRCHCTTAPYVDEDEYNMWLEWLNKGGTTSDWNTMSDAEKRAWYRNKETPQGQASTDTFAPAKTIAEAEAYAKTFTDGDRFGALGVSYDGLTVEVANIVNKTVGGFYKKYNVEKFSGIQAPKGNTKLGKLVANATAGYSPVRHGFLLNRKSLKDAKTAEKALRENNEVVRKFYADPNRYDRSKLSKRVLDVLENSKQTMRATVPQTVEEALWHELGHALEKPLKKVGNYDKIKSRMPDYAPKVSGYACESVSEYIAESFCLYNRGETSALDPMLIQAFKECER
jgi:SPP1 gp7 family putative phage head morphogenesis protein